jgi:hypothetical protein
MVHFEQGIDMSLGGGQTETPVAGSNKYAQIMELMRLRQAMTPQPYTGGFNAYVPSSVSAAPSSYYEELLRQQQLANANRGGGRQEVDPVEKARIDAFMDAEDAQDVANGDPVGTTRGERIKSDLGPLAGLLNPFGGIMALADAYKGFQDPRDTSNTGFGANIGRAIGGFFNTGPGYESGPSGRMSETALANLNSQNTISTGMTGLPSSYDTSSSYQGVAAENAALQNALAQQYSDNAANAIATNSNVTDPSQRGGGGGSSFDNSAPGEGYGMTRSGGIDGSMFNKGGQVTMDRLQGPNPMGPDDGYAGLKDGEFVINAKSVGKYGIELMNAINAGKISKGKLRGLLEA